MCADMSSEREKSKRKGKLNSKYYSSEFQTDYKPELKVVSDKMAGACRDLPVYPDIKDIEFPEGVKCNLENRLIGNNEYLVVSDVEFTKDYGIMTQAVREYKTLHHPDGNISEINGGVQMALYLDKLQVFVNVYEDGHIVIQDSEYGEAIIRWVLEEFRKLDLIYTSVMKLSCKPQVPLSGSRKCTCTQENSELLCTCCLNNTDLLPDSLDSLQISQDTQDIQVSSQTGVKELGDTQSPTKFNPVSASTGDPDMVSEPIMNLESLAHVVDVASKTQVENHELALKAIIESKDILASKIDNLASQLEVKVQKSGTPQKSRIDSLKENIRDLQMENKVLQAELLPLRGLPSQLDQANQVINRKSIEIAQLVKDLENSRNLWEVEKQLLKNESDNAISQRDTLEELVEQLKERIKDLSAIGTNEYGNDQDDEIPAQQSKPEYPVKFTEGLNPVLSAFYHLDPPLKYKNEEFKSAEAAFHVERAFHPYSMLSDEQKEEIKSEIMAQDSAVDVKRIADRNIPYTKEWERDQGRVMENIQKKKYDQFPEFRKELDKTRDGVITHPVGDEVWRKLFPNILEKVRDGTPAESASKSADVQQRPWERVWGKHRTCIIGDSITDRIDPSEFGKDTCKVSCYTCEEFLKFAQECQENRKAETVMVTVGINNTKGGAVPQEVYFPVCDGLDLLRKKCPNAKICYNQLVVKSTSETIHRVRAVNQHIIDYCRGNDYVFIKHDRLMQSPSNFSTVLKSGQIDEYHPTKMGLYIASMKRELPPRSRSPSPYWGHYEDRNQRGAQRGGNRRARGRAFQRGNPGKRGFNKSVRGGYGQ